MSIRNFQVRDREGTRVFFGKRLNAIILRGLPMAKALVLNGSDGVGRRLGERSGLDMNGKFTKYPSSPSNKLCELCVAYSSGICSAVAKALNSPPGKYGRKTETLRNWRGRTTRSAACGLI